MHNQPKGKHMHRHGIAASDGQRVLFGPAYHATLKYSSDQEFLDNIAADLNLTEVELRFHEPTVKGIRTWEVHGTCAAECGLCCP